MNYNKFGLYVSTPRLRKYKIACDNSESRALELYKANMFLSQAFYPILNNFEVFFRNAVNRELIKHFNDPRWIITEKESFMSDPSLSGTDFYLRNSIEKTERRFRRSRRLATPSAIMAEQEFGFWTSFFETRPFGLVRASVLDVFPLRPSSTDRASIRDMLKEIRDFRNRVYHNEPICFDNGNIDFRGAENVRSKIYILLSWIDGELCSYVRYYDRVDKRLSVAKRV